MKPPAAVPEGVVRAAALLGCRPPQLLGWRLLDEGGVVVIAPGGAKHRFTAAALAEAALPARPARRRGGKRDDRP